MEICSSRVSLQHPLFQREDPPSCHHDPLPVLLHSSPLPLPLPLPLQRKPPPPPPPPPLTAPPSLRTLLPRGQASSREPFELSQVWSLHFHIIISGVETDPVYANPLLSRYGELLALQEASSAFSMMRSEDTVSWNIMMSLYAKNGRDAEALDLFLRMQEAGIASDRVTFLGALQACGSLGSLECGHVVHLFILEAGLGSHVALGTALIDMYAKCGALDDANDVFESMPERNVVSWTAIITANVSYGRQDVALELFHGQMSEEGIEPNQVTFTQVLQACTHLPDGEAVHARMVEHGLGFDEASGTALVDMYGKCKSLESACVAFDTLPTLSKNVVTWTTMMNIYLQHGEVRKAFYLYRILSEEGAVIPNEFTYSTALTACAELSVLDESEISALVEGERIHGCIIRKGLDSDVIETALIAMYAKCGRLETARLIFDGMNNRCVVSWTAMISSYAQQGHPREALKLFKQMQNQGLKPNAITCVSILSACAVLAAYAEGMSIHSCVLECGFELDAVMGTALISFYGKCAALEDAETVFLKLEEPTVVPWNAIISAKGENGHGRESLALLLEMLHGRVKPDDVTFINMISACSHAGLVDVGRDCYDAISDYGLIPSMEHYGCLIDLFGRSGQLAEAEALITRMPLEPNALIWRTFLSACRMHGDTRRGVHAAKRVVDLDPLNSAPYVLLSNIYAAQGKWKDVEMIRRTMVKRGVKKEPGCSAIEVNNKVYEFFAAVTPRSKHDVTYAKLESLMAQLKEMGYVPDTKLVLHDVEEEQKEHMLAHHSEKLAIAFGLVSTAKGTTLRITKNLRVCTDCHNAAKFISKLERREILLRDVARYHRFSNGVCSCGDYW